MDRMETLRDAPTVALEAGGCQIEFRSVDHSCDERIRSEVTADVSDQKSRVIGLQESQHMKGGR